MGIGDIVLHVDRTDRSDKRIDVALELGQVFDARVLGLCASRVRELVLGGVTKSMLQQMTVPVPVLMSH